MTARPDPLSDDDLERSLRASRELIDAPEHVIQRALATLTLRRAGSAKQGGGLLQRIAAVLAFDSGSASPLAFGMRSSGTAVRQLLYTVEGRDIDLRVVPGAEPATFALSGQVLGPDSLGVMVMQPDAEGPRREVVLSELGEFQLPPVPPGRYRLTLEIGDQAIELPLLQIPHAA